MRGRYSVGLYCFAIESNSPPWPRISSPRHFDTDIPRADWGTTTSISPPCEAFFGRLPAAAASNRGSSGSSRAPTRTCRGLPPLCRRPAALPKLGAVPDAPSGFDPGLERRAEYVGILCQRRSLVGHPSRVNAPARRAARHRGADRRRSTRGQAGARPLSDLPGCQTPSRSAALRFGVRRAENGSRCGISLGTRTSIPGCSRIRGRFRVLCG